MPSVLLCSFGQYDLDIFEAEYPTLYLGNYEVVHTFEDMLTPSVLNKTSAFAPGTDLNISGAYGHNDLVTMVQNCGNMTASRPNDLPHLSVNASGFCNFSLPQLMGVVRSAAVNATNPVEAYNGLSKTRWCIMWTPYRLTLDHPSDVSLSNAAISTGSVDYRQLDTRQVWRVGINLNGRALMEDQAWQNVWQDPGGPEANTGFAPTLSVKFIDFSGMREEEWLSGSQSSQYLKDVLESSDPDGFELVTLNSIVTLSVQKTVTTTLSGLQKLGWPWTPWPWSDNSAYQVSCAKIAVACHTAIAIPAVWKQHQSISMLGCHEEEAGSD